MPRKKRELTDEEKRVIREASGLAIPQDQIARLLGVATSTFKLWVSQDEEINELVQEGKAIALRKVARKLMDLIEEGNEAAIFFYLKCQGGWREKDKAETATLPEIKIYLPQKEPIE
jgi:DNA-binding transcriptional regulator YiaG